MRIFTLALLAMLVGCEQSENKGSATTAPAQVAASTESIEEPSSFDRSSRSANTSTEDRDAGSDDSRSSPDRDSGKLRIVEDLDLNRYMGRWYEVARYPNMFQRGIVAVITTYTLQDDGTIRIDNYGREGSLDGEVTETQSSAVVQDKGDGAIWRVKFFPLVTAPYWIIDLGPNYEYAVVGQPSRKYLWVLSRTPQIDEKTYRGICERLKAQGYDPGKIVRTPQPESQDQ